MHVYMYSGYIYMEMTQEMKEKRKEKMEKVSDGPVSVFANSPWRLWFQPLTSIVFFGRSVYI